MCKIQDTAACAFRQHLEKIPAALRKRMEKADPENTAYLAYVQKIETEMTEYIARLGCNDPEKSCESCRFQNAPCCDSYPDCSPIIMKIRDGEVTGDFTRFLECSMFICTNPSHQNCMVFFNQAIHDKELDIGKAFTSSIVDTLEKGEAIIERGKDIGS